MNNCLECGKEVPQTAGKRKKEYCGNTCRVKFYLKKKNEGKPKGKRGRPKKSELEKSYEKTLNKIVNYPENKKAIEQSTKDLIQGNRSVTKNELVDGKVKITNNPKLIAKEANEFLKIDNPMPKGLSLIQQLEWREKNAKS